MTIDTAVFYGQIALMTTMYVAGPLMLVALAVGSIVSAFRCDSNSGDYARLYSQDCSCVCSYRNRRRLDVTANCRIWGSDVRKYTDAVV